MLGEIRQIPFPPSTRRFKASSKHQNEYSRRFCYFNQDDFSEYICSRTSKRFYSPPNSHPEKKKHLSTWYTQITEENKADPILTKMILIKVLQIFRIKKINFEQNLILHNHPDSFIQKSDATTQTDYTTIRPNSISETDLTECVLH